MLEIKHVSQFVEDKSPSVVFLDLIQGNRPTPTLPLAK